MPGSLPRRRIGAASATFCPTIVPSRGDGRLPPRRAPAGHHRRAQLHPAHERRDRPWQIGILWRADRRLCTGVLEALRARTDLWMGDNQPYSGLDEFGFTIEFHGQRAGCRI